MQVPKWRGTWAGVCTHTWCQQSPNLGHKSVFHSLSFLLCDGFCYVSMQQKDPQQMPALQAAAFICHATAPAPVAHLSDRLECSALVEVIATTFSGLSSWIFSFLLTFSIVDFSLYPDFKFYLPTPNWTSPPILGSAAQSISPLTCLTFISNSTCTKLSL